MLIKILRKFILGAVILYGYNFIAVNFGLMIPINIYSLFAISLLGTPSLIALVAFKVLIL